MTILITGSSGKTSSRLATSLLSASQPILIASRKGLPPPSGAPAVRFDWTDPSTFALPFAHPAAAASPITAAYLVAPDGVLDTLGVMRPFIEEARSRDVRRFVLLGASRFGRGDVFLGKVHEYLAESGVEWAVLRPTWFDENFLEQPIKSQGKVYSAAGAGKIPFVSTEDIAAVAHAALVSEQAPNREYTILGPELLSYDEAAAILSEILGRKITHVNLTVAEFKQLLVENGMRDDYATMLAGLETHVEAGAEAVLDDTLEKVIGRPAITFRQFVESHKSELA